LLLSCDLDTNYVSRFASAGIPNINKLLRKNSGGFIEKGDTIYDIELKGNPKIIIYQKNGDQILFNFKKGDNHNYLRGLYFKDNALFVYQEIRLKWEKVEGFDIKSQYSVEFKDFNLKIQKTNSSVRISSLRDLEINHINQIVCL
jgi:hypothetical protein